MARSSSIFEVVTGPPCGGKTTYVREHMKPGDVVLDFDHLASALAGQDAVTHDHPEHIRRTAAALHYRARRILAQMREYDGTVWVIFAAPAARELAQWESWGWRITTIDPGRAVVEHRCRSSRPKEAMQWVSEWYAANGGRDG